MGNLSKTGFRLKLRAKRGSDKDMFPCSADTKMTNYQPFSRYQIQKRKFLEKLNNWVLAKLGNLFLQLVYNILPCSSASLRSCVLSFLYPSSSIRQSSDSNQRNELFLLSAFRTVAFYTNDSSRRIRDCQSGKESRHLFPRH